MKRRTFFGKALAVLAAPFVAKAAPRATVMHYKPTAEHIRNSFRQMMKIERMLQDQADERRRREMLRIERARARERYLEMERAWRFGKVTPDAKRTPWP